MQPSSASADIRIQLTADNYISDFKVFTLAIVINGVYGGGARRYVFIGFTVVAVAFFTVTYRAWWEARKAWRQEREQREAEEYARQREARQAAEREEEEAKQRRSRRHRSAERVGRLKKSAAEAARQADRARVMLETEDAAENTDARETLESALARVEDSRALFRDLNAGLRDLEPIREAAELETACERIEDAARSVGIGMEARLKSLNEAARQLKQQRGRVRVLAGRREDQTHCMACGRAAPPSRFCPHCGLAATRRLVCRQCGNELLLPAHLLDWTRASRPLHCTRCGLAQESLAPRLKG